MAQPQPQLQHQPNYQRLTDAFTTAAEECSRLPNIPAIRGSQTLIEAIDQLRNQMTEQFNTLRADITTLRADITTLQNDVTTLRTDVTTIRADTTTLRADVTTLQTNITARFDANEINATARLYNSTINNAQTPFQPLQDHHNMPVPNFPVNGEALSNLNRVELLTILRAYNLPADGEVPEKRKRLASYIGIVVQVF